MLWNVCWGRSETFSGECPLLLCPTAALIMCIAASSVIFTSAAEPRLGLTSTTSTADSRCVLYDSSIIWIPSRNVKPPRTVWSARENLYNIYRIEMLFIIMNVRNMASLVQYTKFKILLIAFTSTSYSHFEENVIHS